MSPVFTGIALGAAGAFFLDPQQGRQRRALLRDKMVHTSREAREFRDAAAKDLRARARGISASMRGLRGGPVGDDVLVARVRARLGRYVSHPHAITVTAQNGYVTLSGDILAGEHAGLLRALRSVSGIRDYADRLDVHASAEGISALQGDPLKGGTPAGQPLEILQARWSPGTRALVAGAGGVLALYALVRGGLTGVAALASGAALMARAKANQPLADLMRSARSRSQEALAGGLTQISP